MAPVVAVVRPSLNVSGDPPSRHATGEDHRGDEDQRIPEWVDAEYRSRYQCGDQRQAHPNEVARGHVACVPAPSPDLTFMSAASRRNR
jgi:hypothetical protein